KSQIYKIYITAMIFGLVAMGLSGALGEKRGLAKEILLSGIAFFIASYALFATENSLSVFVIAVILFFIGFNMHEPIMQSLASKFAKSHQKGSALGVFNSFGFLGSFVGGVFGGIALKEIGLFYLALVVVVLAVIWFILLLNLTNPIIFKNLYFDKSVKADFTALSDTHGIIECYETEKNFIVKYNRKRISKHQILKKLGLTR
ncbi:MAG: MFS transporter, partial [Campylobacter sp.]|nr:MFS transporter [Campylobacter sp.]